MEEGLELSPADQPVPGSVEHDEMSQFREAYMAIVGALLWLANMTRVDIAYSASQLARFMTCLLYTSPSPRDKRQSRMPSSA